jgi:hypothetical protein
MSLPTRVPFHARQKSPILGPGIAEPYATTRNRTPSCSCKQAMILNRFAAVGLTQSPSRSGRGSHRNE